MQKKLKQVTHLYVKIEQRKLSWNATSKIGSFEKASTNNIKHRPGGGKVEVGLIEIKTFDWN